MGLDFSAKILDLDDKPFDDTTTMSGNGYLAALEREQKAKTEAEAAEARKDAEKLRVPLTLGAACRHALSAAYRDEPELSGDKKFERGMLAYRIAKGEVDAFTSEETTMVKPLIGKFFGPVVVLRAFEMLDPVAAAKAAAGKAPRKK